MTQENQNIMAWDDGYGDSKFDGKGQPDLIPSFVTTFKPKPKDAFSGTDKGLRYIATEVDGRKYVVGDYAMKLDPNISWIGGEHKHGDSRFPVLLKTTLGLMTAGPHEVIDTLMMNLPIKYDTPERRKELTRLVQDTHEVTLSYDGINFNRKVITVEHVDIKKQPFGSICDIMLNGNGDIENKEVARGFNVLVDIGARTLNILTLDQLEEQPALTIQTNDGMFVPYMQVGNYLEDELRVIIPDGKLPMIMKDKEIKGRDITSLISQVYEAHASKILTNLDKLLVNSWGFVTNVIFTGGGSEVLKPWLNKNIGNANILFLDRFSNVRGLRKYGLRQAKKRTPQGITARIGSYEQRN